MRTDERTGEVLDDLGGPDLVDPERVTAWCEYVARRVAPDEPPAPGLIKTPDSIIYDLEMLGHLAAQNVRIVREADRTRRTAKRTLARARALALREAKGRDVESRKAETELATLNATETVDNAEVAYQYARDLAALVRDRTSAVQTQSKQVELTYQLSGAARA
ncbi:hypothetical protein [Gryllotalpicola protaetiae]|uniref:Uncharacterized protein n=1 Tax=Gryllotalpicola protaetiae TaxID=2419771 RepID=A0A387BI81_9MICO|nr:hypothetical protein [Gryllotalpicola protaetiae]AYG02398.1 hypothetical protein D7I44_01835 [Gryllotalpicola protaetiae]